MGWVEDLHGEIVAIGTAPLIYYIERKAGYVEILRPFFQAVDRGKISVVTSIISLLETLVHPFRHGDTDLARQYRDILFHTRNLATIQLSQDIAEKAAQLRAFHNIRTPDAIQIATALNTATSSFLTNDTHLPSLPGLQVLVLDELKSRLSS